MTDAISLVKDLWNILAQYSKPTLTVLIIILVLIIVLMYKYYTRRIDVLESTHNDLSREMFNIKSQSSNFAVIAIYPSKTDIKKYNCLNAYKCELLVEPKIPFENINSFAIRVSSSTEYILEDISNIKQSQQYLGGLYETVVNGTTFINEVNNYYKTTITIYTLNNNIELTFNVIHAGIQATQIFKL